MKLRYLTCCVLAASCFSLPAFADSDDMNPDLPAPDIGQYTAYAPPQPSRIKLFFEHVYISGKIGVAFMRTTAITTNTAELINNVPSATPQYPIAEDEQISKGIAVGYNLPSFEDTLFNRLEIEYVSRSNFNYNAVPIVVGGNFNTTSLSSTIDNQTLFAKWYTEIKFGHFPLRPFLVGGLGLARNKIKSNSYFVDQSEGNPALNGSSTVTKNNLGWSLGAGIAYPITKHFSVDADYELVWLGHLQWNIPTNLGYTAVLQSNRFYANTINGDLRITL